MGLGNPGTRYEKTRHNVGFMFLDSLKTHAETQTGEKYEWKLDKYADAKLLELPLSALLHNKSEQVTPEPTTNNSQPTTLLLVKPQTFMNRSGFSANKLLANTVFHSQTINNELALPDNRQNTTLIVIHDDLDIHLGDFKLSFGKGPKLHNGIASIESSLRFKDFWRVRIGVDNRTDRLISGEEYVLGSMRPEEARILQDLFSGQLISTLLTQIVH